MMRRLVPLLPIAVIVFVLVVLPVVAFTESSAEQDLKEAIGLDLGECEAETNLASPWQEGPGLALDRDEPRAATIGGEIYLVGGTLNLEAEEDGSLLLEASDSLTRFDPRSGRYEELAPVPRPVNHAAVTSHRGMLYVAGGYGNRLDTGTSDRFYRYDPARDAWTELAPLPVARAAGVLAPIGDELIYAGGALAEVPQPDTFAYDIAADRWRRLQSMHSRREHVGGTIAGGYLYVLGGRGSEREWALDTAERYDPRRDRWETLPPLPVGVGGLVAVTVAGEPVAVGGGNDAAETVSGAVQEYEPERGEWQLLPEMRTPRHGHGAAVVDDTIWVFGGSECAFFNPTDKVEWFSPDVS